MNKDLPDAVASVLRGDDITLEANSELTPRQLRRRLRAVLMHEARPGRVITFALPLAFFLLAPLYGQRIFATPDEILGSFRIIEFGLIVPAALIGLLASLRLQGRPELADRLVTLSCVAILLGIVLARAIGLPAGFDFPFALTCFYVVAMLIVARVPFRSGSVAGVVCGLLVIGNEWWVRGFTPSANFNVLTALLVVGVAIYTARVLEQTTLRWLENEQRLRQLADVDGLSGLLNRRAGLQRAAELFRRASRHHTRIAIAILDIDHFKSINDNHGHAVGDEVIRACAGLIARGAIGDDDFAVRLGGEEFLVAWSEVRERQDAHERAWVLCDAMSDLVVVHDDDGNEVPPVTATIGVAEGIPSQTSSLKDFMVAADKALYEGKYAGRNRVVMSPPFQPRPAPVPSQDESERA